MAAQCICTLLTTIWIFFEASWLGLGLRKTGAELRFKGVVQGVGFRPFLHNLAARHHLLGYVRNLGDAGVQVHIEGDCREVEGFIQELRTTSPPICQIRDLQVEDVDYSGRFHGFAIYPSDKQRSTFGSVIPPDIAICGQCTKEILDPTSRWYLYPFTCCASCGPRFTAIRELPYDRDRTNMTSFPMCPTCLTEYQNSRDRRFHAQGIACSSCGPHVKLYDRVGQPIESGRPLQNASRLLDEGAILGVKGIGGVHVAASAILDGPLDRIRARKGKPFQPFAVMSRDLGEIRGFAEFSDLEAQLLQDWTRPIVALRKSSGYCLSKLVAPNLDTVGVMLPYTGIHLLLTHFSRSKALVMTSGNITGIPMAITNEEAVGQLSDVVDYFLLHDREIVTRCDDSVIRVLGGVPTFIRRSRGYVPIPIEVPFTVESDAIGFGAELRVTGSILHKNHCYLTQHVGDVDNFEAVSFLRGAIYHLSDLVGISPKEAVIVHDAHPKYLSSRLAGDLAREWGTRVQSVQHHHAHAASLMAENMVPPDESMVVIVADGVGYGLDGDIWGGEVLVASYRDFERVGHLARQPMPGGDACTHFPLRMCASILSQHLDDSQVRAIILSRKGSGCLNEDDLNRLAAQIGSGVGVNWTSSTGRVLDAMAAGAGLCLERTYQGEPAMILEAAAGKGNPKAFSPSSNLIVNSGGIQTVDTSQLLLEALLAIDRIGFSNVCASFQRILSKALASIATEVARERGINRIGVSGGVAVNVNIVEAMREHIEGERFTFIQHRAVPPGDGGIALGQVVIAARGL